MLPLLHLAVWRLRIQFQIVQSALLEVQAAGERPRRYSHDKSSLAYDYLNKPRFWLRRRLEDLEESRNCFAKYVRSHNAAEWLKGDTWLSQYEAIREAVIEARAKEAEARDEMKFQIGNLSILESKKSIHLSNRQMEEAKRGKKCEPPNTKKIY